MEIIDIPYHPEGPQGWKIPIPGDGDRTFPTRQKALAFALTLAKQHDAANGSPGCLCVEGGDGTWRLFTTDLVPVK